MSIFVNIIIQNLIDMALLCNCPEDATLESVVVTCSENFGQVQKILVQRIYSAAGVANKVTNPDTLASWTPLLAAADGTKVVVSPYLQAPVTEPGAARTYGGGNETLGGIEIIIGREPSSFSANLLSLNQSAIASLKKLQCENVGVYLVDEFGRIGCLVDGTDYYPIPVKALFVGDKSLGGLENPDMNTIQWKFLPNWSDTFTIVVPDDFNALELANA